MAIYQPQDAAVLNQIPPSSNSRRITINNDGENKSDEALVIINSHFVKGEQTVLDLVRGLTSESLTRISNENKDRCIDKTIYVIGEVRTQDGDNLANYLFNVAKAVHFIKSL